MQPGSAKRPIRERRSSEIGPQTDASTDSAPFVPDEPMALRSVLDKLGQGLCVFDGAHRLVLFNGCYAEMYGIAPDALRVGMSLPEVIDQRFAVGTEPDMTREAYAAWRGRIAVENRICDSLVHLRDGRVIAVHHEPTPDGGWVATHDDITERVGADTQRTESEARLRALTDALPQIVWLMRASDGEATYINRQFSIYYGMIGTSAAARLARNHPDDAPRMAKAWQAVVDGRQIEMEARLRRHDGVHRWHKLMIIPVRCDGEIVEWIGTALDIDDIIAARSELADTAGLLRTTLESMDQGLILFSADLRVRLYNLRARELLDLPETILHEGSSHTTINRYKAARGEFSSGPARLMRTLEAGDLATLPDVYERQRLNGTSLEVRGTRLADGGYLRTYTDITERKERDRQIAHMAVHDALTGLPNRLLFRDRLEHQLAETKRRGGGFAVLACDLDRFKTVNDTWGHPAGDRLLRAVADRLKTAIREGDTVARLGGDEFAIILSRLDGPQGASLAAQRVIEAVGVPVDLDGETATIGVSIGIALGTADCEDADSLFKNADFALYRAKAAGRNTYSFYEPGMDAAMANRNRLERDLREAVRDGGLTLHYQPILNLAGDATSGFEALMRWPHPERGLISPAEFIPLAEETGLIVPMGTWALQEACREAAGWPGELRVAVNVSAVQFQKPGLEQAVVSALAASGLAPQRLELEITESLLMEDSAAAISCLHRLRGLGVRVALDDFGTGYSSLSYLRRFPFDKIKIDRSFVGDIANPDTAAIVRAIVGIGARLGATITAEGVEADDQLERVRLEGCTEVQGFLYSRPITAGDALMFARKRRIRDVA